MILNVIVPFFVLADVSGVALFLPVSELYAFSLRRYNFFPIALVFFFTFALTVSFFPLEFNLQEVMVTFCSAASACNGTAKITAIESIIPIAAIASLILCAILFCMIYPLLLYYRMIILAASVLPLYYSNNFF